MGRQDLLKKLTPENLNRILTHPYYKECMEFMDAKVEEFLASDPPYVTYTAMEGYYRNGSRDPYSNIYWYILELYGKNRQISLQVYRHG